MKTQNLHKTENHDPFYQALESFHNRDYKLSSDKFYEISMNDSISEGCLGITTYYFILSFDSNKKNIKSLYINLSDTFGDDDLKEIPNDEKYNKLLKQFMIDLKDTMHSVFEDKKDDAYFDKLTILYNEIVDKLADVRHIDLDKLEMD